MKWFLYNKDGTKQEVEMIYYPILEEGGFCGEKKTIYKEPMAVVKIIGIDIEKPWSYKVQPLKFLKYV